MLNRRACVKEFALSGCHLSKRSKKSHCHDLVGFGGAIGRLKCLTGLEEHFPLD